MFNLLNEMMESTGNAALSVIRKCFYTTFVDFFRLNFTFASSLSDACAWLRYTNLSSLTGQEQFHLLDQKNWSKGPVK